MKLFQTIRSLSVIVVFALVAVPAVAGGDNGPGGGQAEVRVRWADTRDVDNKLEVVTRAQL